MAGSKRELQGLTFPAQYLEAVESLARAQRQDAESFYRSCGIDRAGAFLPWQTIDGWQMQSALRYILRLCPAGAPPVVTFMAHFPLTTHGPVGMLAITSATLGDALQGTLKYAPLVMPAFRMRREDLRDEVHLVIEGQHDFDDVNDFFTETVVMAFSRIVHFLTRPISGIVINLRHPPLGDPAQYEAFFGCKFLFNAQQDKIVLPRQELSIPLVTPSRASNLLMKATLDQQSLTRTDTMPIASEVKRQLQRALKQKQVLDANALASAMAMAPRTLSRRLKEEGVTLPQLRTEVGVEYAEMLLLDSGKTVGQIAQASGFADAASFARAFKRSKGEAPSQWRLGASRQGVQSDQPPSN
ncbi:AraC family transcriptional regulator ligand-binding domain-containing protein [Aquabacterium sp.]|uniref:AraC family transcriptional regulator n=1 Tax=Aquabacterium sp. TaxID=1872578 RepID=UPI003D6C7710